jgi:uncharacterized protein YlaN (UPF0358 family)
VVVNSYHPFINNIKTKTMTAQEKAKELLVKMTTNTNDDVTLMYKNPYAKQCALIAVDEILDDDMYDMSQELFENRINYWQQVKQEIENL